MHRIASLGDRLLSSLVPKAKASAACPPSFYQYRCYRNGVSGLYQRRSCIYIAGCLVSCGSWVTIGYCV
ncbi:hypothetical protein SAMN05421812_12329 [Asanoa hainanensis]|uniref:Uncharacterized protein n=1 Tax=Asanoa hainanensis TaxID=560556 RepID=A0A239PEG7_9ACTN|nr:hypothetical protein [Asanoa hainanensis]SNT65476.1 hypothetical protein SAMN05421812_12329 [Asanoa hainanensis]